MVHKTNNFFSKRRPIHYSTKDKKLNKLSLSSQPSSQILMFFDLELIVSTDKCAQNMIRSGCIFIAE